MKRPGNRAFLFTEVHWLGYNGDVMVSSSGHLVLLDSPR